MLADDLLKQHTIPELRELVNTLENDSKSKQTELQHMVGSKYHDFIQSADLIAEMQQQVEEMEKKLSSFWKYSKELIACSDDLLERALKPDEQSVQRKSKPLHIQGKAPRTFSLQYDMRYERLCLSVESSSVWSCLEECDIYGAATIISQAKIILEFVFSTQGIKDLVFSKHFSSTFRQNVATNNRVDMRTVSLAAFLQQVLTC